MEFASIEREIRIDAPPEIVFEVVSQPRHIREWWNVDYDVPPVAGAAGELAWADGDNPRAHVEQMTVVVSDPPRVFTFRWTHPAGEAAVHGNSLLVTFELVPDGDGTLLRLTETGFRERGWQMAVLEEQYQAHVTGWGLYVPRIGEYVTQLVQAP